MRVTWFVFPILPCLCHLSDQSLLLLRVTPPTHYSGGRRHIKEGGLFTLSSPLLLNIEGGEGRRVESNKVRETRFVFPVRNEGAEELGPLHPMDITKLP